MGALMTIEGGEYVGKSVMMKPLERVLAQGGYEVKVSREPGGTPRGEEIRETIFRRLKEGADQKELALLFNQARQIHLDEVIIPFLGRKRDNNRVMFLDRYMDTTRVLQGREGGVAQRQLRTWERKYAYDYFPDLTAILYFPDDVFEKTFLERRALAEGDSKRSSTVWDDGAVEVQRQRQEYYLQLPMMYSETGVMGRAYAMVDASGTPETVLHKLISIVSPLLRVRGVTGMVDPEDLPQVADDLIKKGLLGDIGKRRG